MGLQAWYPLINDMHNQGVGDTDLVVETTPAFGAGKIGNALISGGNSHWTAAQSEKVLNNNAISICFWVYVDAPEGDTNKRAMFFGNNNKRNYALFQYPSCNDFHWSWYSYDSSSTGTFITGGTLSGALPSYEWTHVAITYSNPNGAIYINGEKKQTFSGVMNNYTFSNQTPVIYQCQYRKLNDFRIYDHALSPREVKEISKGLVLHYPLSMPGQENLLLNTATPVSWTTTYTNTDQWSVKDIYNMESPVNQLFAANDTATFSFDWEFTPGSSGSITGNFHLETGNVTPWILGSVSKSTGTRNNASNYIDLSTTNKSGHVTCTFIVSSSAATAADTFRYFRIRWDKTPTDGTLTLSNCKLERGEVATPWMPNPADTEYSTLGFNDGIEYDVSGYQYNGEKFGNLTYSTNTSRYNTCYEFDGSTTYVRLKHGLYSILRLARDEVTMNIWAYKDNWKDYESNGTSSQLYTMCGCQEGGGISIYVTGNGRFQFICGTGETSNTYKVSVTPIGYVGTLPNGWHMLTLTFDGFNLNGYVDGKLAISNAFFTTKTPIYYNTGTTSIYIGVESGSGKQAGYWWKGKLSDFRVYTTALSASDILELYHTPETLANNGTLLTQGEYVES